MRSDTAKALTDIQSLRNNGFLLGHGVSVTLWMICVNVKHSAVNPVYHYARKISHIVLQWSYIIIIIIMTYFKNR